MAWRVLTTKGDVSRILLASATAGGADALGVEAGRIEAGLWADLVTLDLDHSSRVGTGEAGLLDAVVFGAGNEVVRETCVGGRWREPEDEPIGD